MLTLALLYRWTIWSLERSKNSQGHVLSDRRLLDSWSACPYPAHGEHGSGGTADCFLHLSVGRVGEGSGTPLQYSCLENPMDGGASKAAVHGVAEGRTRLRDLTFTFHFHALDDFIWKSISYWLPRPILLGNYYIPHIIKFNVFSWTELKIRIVHLSQRVSLEC